jgi:inhibitor of cysteine peptidase
MVNKARVQKKLIIMLGVILIMAFSCATSRGRTIRASDNGDEIELRRGQTVAVELGGNPSTGYTWEAVEFDEQVLRQIGEPSFTPDSDAAGAPGTQVLRFRAVEEGSTTLRLVYHRPWEDAEPERSFSVEIVVR